MGGGYLDSARVHPRRVCTVTHGTPPPFVSLAALSGTLSGRPPLLPSWVTSGGHSDRPSPGPSAPTAPPGVGPPSAPLDTQPKQADPPLRLPATGLLAIPAPLVQRIRDGAFVDMGDLLPEALQWAFDWAIEDKAEKERRKKFPIDTVADWALAFATYMAIRVPPSPGLTRTLATYMTIILRLAREVPGLAWQRYD